VGVILKDGGTIYLAVSVICTLRAGIATDDMQRNGLATVTLRADGSIGLLGTCLQTPIAEATALTFWEFLVQFGAAWMWEDVNGDLSDMSWAADALRHGTAMLVADGSFNRGLDDGVCSAGWVFLCKQQHKVVKGSFYERSPSAGSYRGEVLGLVALHTLAYALGDFCSIDSIGGSVHCDNLTAVNKTNNLGRRISTGALHGDCFWVLRTLKGKVGMRLTYHHVKSHQDRHKTWETLPLDRQVNVVCDALAGAAIL
jgi:hypothetical protein